MSSSFARRSSYSYADYAYGDYYAYGDNNFPLSEQQPQDPPPQYLLTSWCSNVWWYVLGADQQFMGPYTIAALQEYHSSGYLHERTLVWTEGCSDWQPLSSVLWVSTEFPQSAAYSSTHGVAPVRYSDCMETPSFEDCKRLTGEVVSPEQISSVTTCSDAECYSDRAPFEVGVLGDFLEPKPGNNMELETLEAWVSDPISSSSWFHEDTSALSSMSFSAPTSMHAPSSKHCHLQSCPPPTVGLSLGTPMHGCGVQQKKLHGGVLVAPNGLFPPEPEHYCGPKLKVTIIGAGLDGMSTAVEFLDQGHEVDIYDSRSFIVGGKVGSFVDKNVLIFDPGGDISPRVSRCVTSPRCALFVATWYPP